MKAGPICNEKLPECGLLLLTLVKLVSPVFTQGGKLPVSKSPLTTMQPLGVSVAVGVGVMVGVGVGVPPPLVAVTHTSSR
jgi:hypothetical protein